ncbi:MAG TPA: hypothetical protein VLH59_07395 [Ignavibacteriaceae bacterium]|nr:hypothetical protein [Ignavibacteriaceae bacterium]
MTKERLRPPAEAGPAMTSNGDSGPESGMTAMFLLILHNLLNFSLVPNMGTFYICPCE